MKRFAIQSLVLVSLFPALAMASSRHLEHHHHSKDEPIVLRLNGVGISQSHHPDDVVSELRDGAHKEGVDGEIDETSSNHAKKTYDMSFKGHMGDVERFCDRMADSDDTDVAVIGKALLDELESKLSHD